MNKKEVNEIKKNFTDKSGFFTMERILTGFIDAEKNVLYHHVSPCITMPIADKDVYDTTLIKVLSTAVGKKNVEYEFPNTTYEEGQPQNLLYKLLDTKLKEDEICVQFLNHIANTIAYTGPFTVITAYCTYSVRKKNKNDDIDDDLNEEMYNYILTAICPATTGTDGFIFDRTDNEILKKINTELIIDRAPTDGFLFPTFSNRSADINHVMYYTKSSKTLNISIVENVLGCQFVMSADNEKASYQAILQTVVGDDLNYQFMNTVNDRIQDIIDDNKSSTDVTTIEASQLKEIFSECGLSEERLGMVDNAYKRACGTATLTASNIVEKKNVVQTPGIRIDIKSSFADKLRTSIVDGRRCLLIDIDDPTIEVNGLPINLK